MIFLLLSILSSATIYIVFKLIGRLKIFTFSAIVVNYLVACLAGFFLSSSNPFSQSVYKESWFPVSLIIGVLFIILFYVIGKSTQKAGMAVTTVANKMSVVFPIAFSIWYDASDVLSLVKSAGIILALVAVFLTIYRKSAVKIDISTIILPAALFLGMGLVDTFVKYAQSSYVSDDVAPVFSTIIFAAAGLIGLLILPFNSIAAKNLLKGKTWILGAVLGLANFGSIYFLLLALNHVNISTGEQVMGSVVFGINNIGIVAICVLTGFAFFKERPTRTNWVGIGLSIVAILILSYS